MDKKKVSIILGIMCFVLTYAIFVQVKTVTNSNSTVSQNIEENNLRAEVLQYKEKYDSYSHIIFILFFIMLLLNF